MTSQHAIFYIKLKLEFNELNIWKENEKQGKRWNEIFYVENQNRKFYAIFTY